MIDVIKQLWGPIMAGVGLIVWFARLEGLAKGNTREIIRLEKRMDEDRADAKAQRGETNDMLREVRSDIKRLLERNA